MNKNKSLFIDSSVTPQTKVGYGAYLYLDHLDISQIDKKKIQTKMFTNTSSTKIELETLLWALNSIDIQDETNLTIYTDCQNIITLPSRKDKLESKNYKTSTNKLVKNHELYKKFFKALNKYTIRFVKVEGHKRTKEKDNIDKIFTFVDRASRAKLRKM